MNFIIGIFQHRCKSNVKWKVKFVSNVMFEHKHVKWKKSNETCANLTVFLPIYKVVHDLNDFWNLFFHNVYLKTEWKQFWRKNVLDLISFRKCRGNWANLAKKNLQTGAQITTIFRVSWKCLNLVIIKTF